MKKIWNVVLCFLLMFLMASCFENVNTSKSKTPSFLGYFIESERIEVSAIQPKGLKRANSEEMHESIITDEMNANKGEYLFITLQFVNEERDTFVDLVLDDSDYGDDIVYDSLSAKNKIHSVETYKKDSKWTTDVTIVLQKTKSDSVRNIEIKEVNFLKQVINQTVSADLETESLSTKLQINVIEEYVPTSKYLFSYEEVEYDGITGYEITKINYEPYGYPSIIYFPSHIDGIEVISLAKDITPVSDTLSCKVCVIPETLRYFYTRFLNSNVGWVTDKLIILSHHLIDFDPIDPFYAAGDPTTYLWEDYVYEARKWEGYEDSGFEANKLGYNVFQDWVQYISLDTGEPFSEEFKALRRFEFTLSEDGTHYIITDYVDTYLQFTTIPSTYNGLPVTKIATLSFDRCGETYSIVIPDSITVIEDNTFGDWSCVETIYYTGTKEQWDMILKGKNNDWLRNANIIYNYVQ